MIKVCSVNYNSNEYLIMNKNMIIPKGVEWLVVNNHPQDKLLEGFQYIEGIHDFHCDTTGKSIGKASYHHAAALNKACQSGALDKRYILLLDPDFFIIPSLDECINHMQKNDLAFFGAPYSIEPGKNRLQNFPVAFCMFIDATKVDIKSLDFTPKDSSDFSTDTGHGVYHKFANSELKYEAALPVLEHKGQTDIPHSKHNLKNRYGIAHEAKMDQYFWNGKLFGLHCHMKLHLRHGEEIYKRSRLHCLEVGKIIEMVRMHDSVI